MWICGHLPESTFKTPVRRPPKGAKPSLVALPVEPLERAFGEAVLCPLLHIPSVHEENVRSVRVWGGTVAKTCCARWQTFCGSDGICFRICKRFVTYSPTFVHLLDVLNLEIGPGLAKSVCTALRDGQKE